MPSLPESEAFLLVRADFSDDAVWNALREVLDTETDDGFVAVVEYVDDPAFAGCSVAALTAAHPHAADGSDVMYVADEQTMASKAYPLLVVRVGSTDEAPFRCRADTLYEVDANLSLANLDWEDFVSQIGQSGIYGEDEPSVPGPVDPTPPASAPAHASAREALLHIEADLDNPAVLSGVKGDVAVAGTIPGSLSDIRYRFVTPTWLTQGGYDVDGGYRLFRGQQTTPFWDDANRIIPTDGTIECTRVDSPEPGAISTAWQWMRRPAGLEPDRPPYSVLPELLVPLLEPMTVTFRFAPASPEPDGRPATTVHIDHTGVPIEWIEHLDAYWRWMLERADRDFDLGDMRRKLR